jgi:hypothetical protein
MRKIILAAAAMAALSVPAFAADMAVKAPVVQPVPFTAGASSFYWGVESYAGVAQSSVSGTNLFATSLVSGNLTADGGGIGGVLGYLHGSTAALGFGNWWRIQVEADYQNIQGGVSVPGNSASVASRWSATQEFDVGADLVTYIMSALQPNSTSNFPTFTPVLPANVQVGLPKEYFGAILREFGLNGNFGAANGVSVAVAPGIKTGFLYPTLGANGLPNGGGIDLWASVSWATKGNTLNNVFAANGTPLTIGPSADMGTTYLTGITIARGF